tara:strand:+ start:267 stop:713 length:447 start_codon:yes stop_codon:yes gene_type:complete
MKKEQITEIIQNNIREITEKSVLGYNGYYQDITWEIDKNGELHDHWLGGQSVVREEEGSIYFHTKIDQDTSYLLENAYIMKGEWFEEEMYIHPEMEIYKAKLIDENIIDQDEKILDLDSYKEFLFHEFWLQESSEYYLERIKEQLSNK